MALGFKKGDILWTTPNTFVASSNCALHLGGKIDFVDIDYLSGNIDLNLLERKLFFAKKKKNKITFHISASTFFGFTHLSRSHL